MFLFTNANDVIFWHTVSRLFVIRWVQHDNSIMFPCLRYQKCLIAHPQHFRKLINNIWLASVHIKILRQNKLLSFLHANKWWKELSQKSELSIVYEYINESNLLKVIILFLLFICINWFSNLYLNKYACVFPFLPWLLLILQD